MQRNSLYLLVVVLAAVAACSKKETPPPPPPPPPAAKPVQKKMTSATTAPAPGIDFSTKKDPFKPAVAAPRPPAPLRRGKGFAGNLPILSYDTSQFKVLGIIAGLKENRAMVVDPAGKPYVLREGMIIGKEGGKVRRITSTAIEVEERYREDNGRMRTRIVRLVLPRKE